MNIKVNLFDSSEVLNKFFFKILNSFLLFLLFLFIKKHHIDIKFGVLCCLLFFFLKEREKKGGKDNG